MPENNQETKPNDFLENLLTEAASRAAKEEAEQALKKGYVTREQINMALDSFGAKLEETLADKLLGVLEDNVQAALKKALENEELLTKAGARKSTIITPEEERDANPIAYLIKKGRTALAANEEPSYDQVDKDLIWAITEKALSQGMTIDQNEQ